MTILVVPLIAAPSQSLAVRLSDQSCTIRVYTTAMGLFLDLAVNDAPVVSGVACLNGVRMVRDAYLGFVGDLAFVDTHGSEDPQPDGLGSRWILVYVNP